MPANGRRDLIRRLKVKYGPELIRYILNPYTISYHQHHLPPWIRSFELFRHRRVTIVS